MRARRSLSIVSSSRNRVGEVLIDALSDAAIRNTCRRAREASRRLSSAGKSVVFRPLRRTHQVFAPKEEVFRIVLVSRSCR